MEKTCKVISFAINKGGAGKTESSCAIAQVLALCNYKCLVIDLDAQRNATRLFGAEYDVSYVDHQQLIVDEMNTEQMLKCIKKSNFGNIDIIPGTIDLYNIEDPLCLAATKYDIAEVLTCFKHNLDQIREYYEYIIIDTSPSLGRLNQSAVAASDMVVSPLNTDSRSMDALNSQIDFVKMVNNICKTNCEYKGVFFTQVFDRTNMAKAYMSEAMKGLQDFYIDAPIRYCTAAKSAASVPEPLFKHAPRCNTSLDYIRLAVNMRLVDRAHLMNLGSSYSRYGLNVQD